MTLYDIHLILPEATEFDSMPQPLQDQLNALDAKWPSFPGIGTKSDSGKKLIHARIRHPALSKAVLEGLFAAFALDWAVAGIREANKVPAVYDHDGVETQAAHYPVIEAIDKATILPYIEDKPEIDSNGVETVRAVTLADRIDLSMYSGFDPVVLV